MLVSLFEEANYSLHVINREHYTRFYRAMRRYREVLDAESARVNFSALYYLFFIRHYLFELSGINPQFLMRARISLDSSSVS